MSHPAATWCRGVSVSGLLLYSTRAIHPQAPAAADKPGSGAMEKYTRHNHEITRPAGDLMRGYSGGADTQRSSGARKTRKRGSPPLSRRIGRRLSPAGCGMESKKTREGEASGSDVAALAMAVAGTNSKRHCLGRAGISDAWSSPEKDQSTGDSGDSAFNLVANWVKTNRSCLVARGSDSAIL